MVLSGLSPLFVTQRFHGIEPGCPQGRVNAKHDTAEDGNACYDNNTARIYFGGYLAKVIHLGRKRSPAGNVVQHVFQPVDPEDKR